jgi:hypothetical protein
VEVVATDGAALLAALGLPGPAAALAGTGA